MKSSRFLAPLLISSLVLAGCSNNAQPGQEPAKSTETVTFADAPAACPKSTKLTAKTSDLAETTFVSKSNWFSTWSGTPETARLIFSTYDVPKDNTYIDYEYTEKDALVVVSVTDTVTKKAGVGNYSGATDAKIKVDSVNVSSKNLSGGVFDKNGSLEISYLDSKYACGKMKFDDGRNALSGDFIAQVVSQ